MSTQAKQERAPAETARRLVLAQHLELRRLLTAGLEQIRDWPIDDRSHQRALDVLLGTIRETFVEHLADEEALVLPILEDDLPLGPYRALQLQEEHARQRSELDDICRAADAADAGERAARFGRLAAALLDDIAHEERELLIPEVIRDDHVVIDQSGG